MKKELEALLKEHPVLIKLIRTVNVNRMDSCYIYMTDEELVKDVLSLRLENNDES